MGQETRPMNIQFVTTSLMQGGAELQVYLLATQLKRRGHEVSVVSMRDPEAFVDGLQELGIPLHSLAMERGSPDVKAIAKLGNLVRELKPEVVHSHMVHANLLARLTRLFAPFSVQVSTAHNLTEGARWRDYAYRLTDPLCDLTTNVCGKCVERFIQVGATPANKIRYVPNGLDFSTFKPTPGSHAAKRRELGVDDSTFLWLAVGRLEEQKDYPTLFEAVARLVASFNSGPGPWRGMKFVIAGSGSLEERLKSSAREAGLDPHVAFLGDRKDVADLMDAADGYVMSSAWEGLPMVLLEAGAARLPAVVTDVGGNREAVTGEAVGALVPSADAAALASAMTRLMSLGKDELEQMGQRFREHVEGTFGITRVVELWEAVYHELLTRARDGAKPRRWAA